MKQAKRRAFPTGPAPTGGGNDEIVISVAGMDFTVGALRHSGYTEQEIAELRVEGARLLANGGPSNG